MNNLIQLAVEGIIRQEGEPADGFNPGNLRGAPWLEHPVIVAGFWAPPSRAAGVAGIAHVFALHLAQGNTLQDFIAGHPGVYAGFAPGADHNNPAAYIANMKLWMGIPDETVPLWAYIGESGS